MVGADSKLSLEITPITPQISAVEYSLNAVNEGTGICRKHPPAPSILQAQLDVPAVHGCPEKSKIVSFPSEYNLEFSRGNYLLTTIVGQYGIAVQCSDHEVFWTVRGSCCC